MEKYPRKSSIKIKKTAASLLICVLICVPQMYFWMLLSPAGQGIDEPLSETGLKQAVAAGGFLTNVTFTHAFSSDLTRTKQVSGGSRSEDHELCKFERFTWCHIQTSLPTSFPNRTSPFLFVLFCFVFCFSWRPHTC
jgi:hypothetical protein